jgi:formylglycine-generating enzyme required for sulfatase activity
MGLLPLSRRHGRICSGRECSSGSKRVRLTLHRQQETPPGMVWVPTVTAAVPRPLVAPPISLPGFWIDSYEVTNRQYKAFVDAVLDSRSPARVRTTDVRQAIGRTGISPAEPADQRQDVLAFTDGNRRASTIDADLIGAQDALGQLTEACGRAI